MCERTENGKDFLKEGGTISGNGRANKRRNQEERGHEQFSLGFVGTAEHIREIHEQFLREARMTLYLLRHGDAQTDQSIPDQERALTDGGVQSVTRAGNLMEKMQLTADIVYSSPLLRARRTAELVYSRVKSPVPIEFTEQLKVGGDLGRLFALLNANAPDARVLLVGHEPYFSQLVSTLLVGNLDAKADIRKASICCLEAAHPVGPRRGVLKWLIPPHVAELIRP